MKTRRHHNNKGTRQIKQDKPYEQLLSMAKKLEITYRPKGTKKGPYDCLECGVDISVGYHKGCCWTKITHG